MTGEKQSELILGRAEGVKSLSEREEWRRRKPHHNEKIETNHYNWAAVQRPTMFDELASNSGWLHLCTQQACNMFGRRFLGALERSIFLKIGPDQPVESV
ncbi:hypothetical protein PIB30_045809 [Stylosanthes scabra]|uniref:Uncharacterized protein n=1 Tax=Stylosanthes scabra TaxID=79078 RepID=A0ABU6RGA5_9FABA|nr:hypothetical protein [Stylosanthes scabra]